MRKNKWKYFISAFSILILFAVFFFQWEGFAKTQIKNEPSYFQNKEHDYHKFLNRIFYAIQNDTKRRLPKRIYFFYGEKLNRKLELKSAVVYWMKNDTNK